MSVCIYAVFVLSCVQVAALRRADPLSKESYRLCKKIKKLKKAAKAQQRAVEPQMRSYTDSVLARSSLTDPTECLPHLHLRSKTGPVSVTLCFLEYRTMVKVQKPNNSECYTPLSEPFSIYTVLHIFAQLEGKLYMALCSVMRNAL
jgi:hypothetical protein